MSLLGVHVRQGQVLLAHGWREIMEWPEIFAQMEALESSCEQQISACEACKLL